MEHTIKISPKLSWHAIKKPTREILDRLSHLFGLHKIIEEELLAASDRGRVERYGNYMFLVYHIPVYDEKERTSRRAEVDFIVTSKAIATITYESIEPLEKFIETAGESLSPHIHEPVELLYQLLASLNNFSVRELRHIEEKIRLASKDLFGDPNRALLENISYIKRDLLEFSIIAASQKATLESLHDIGIAWWGEDARIYLADLHGDFLKLHYLLERLTATTESYSQTISQLFELRTSEIIRRFSILGFLTFPLILYATIALQERVAPTFIAHAGDFWFVFGLITILIVALAIFFRKKKWL